MNLNLIPFSPVLLIKNSHFYPKKADGSSPLFVFKEENIQIKIKHPEIVAEIGSHFSIIELQYLKKVIYDSDNLQ